MTTNRFHENDLIDHIMWMRPKSRRIATLKALADVLEKAENSPEVRA